MTNFQSNGGFTLIKLVVICYVCPQMSIDCPWSIYSTLLALTFYIPFKTRHSLLSAGNRSATFLILMFSILHFNMMVSKVVMLLWLFLYWRVNGHLEKHSLTWKMCFDTTESTSRCVYRMCLMWTSNWQIWSCQRSSMHHWSWSPST